MLSTSYLLLLHTNDSVLVTTTSGLTSKFAPEQLAAEPDVLANYVKQHIANHSGCLLYCADAEPQPELAAAIGAGGVPLLSLHTPLPIAAYLQTQAPFANQPDFIVADINGAVTAGIVANSKLVLGANGKAGNIGAMQLRVARGDSTSLGYALSTNGLKRQLYHYLTAPGAENTFADKAFSAIQKADIFKAAAQGDQLAQATLLHAAEALGLKLADVVMHFSPSTIALVGEPAESAWPSFVQEVKKAMEDGLLRIFRNKVQLTAIKRPSQQELFVGMQLCASQWFNS
jgi:hypothetical protein